MSNSLRLYSSSQFFINFQSYEPKERYLGLNQTHSNHITTTKSLGKNKMGEDGIIFSATETKMITIKTADCMPICYIGERYIGLIHAGWRGVKSEIYLKPELKKIKPSIIVVGPSICNKCFEVSEDFQREFPSHLTRFKKLNNRLFFELKSLVKDKLSHNFPFSRIKIIDDCTLCNEKWHSYRRNKTSERNFTIFQKQ